MIEENIKINSQPEEFDDSAELEPVTFVTEDGGEENFWHIMTFPYEGAKYAALVPEDQIDEEEPEVIFVKIAKDEQGDAYIPVENDVLLEELFEVFAELLDDEPEEPENDAWV